MDKGFCSFSNYDIYYSINILHFARFYAKNNKLLLKVSKP